MHKFDRKAKTEQEKRAALALIKTLASDVETHVDAYIARGGYPAPPGKPTPPPGRILGEGENPDRQPLQP